MFKKYALFALAAVFLSTAAGAMNNNDNDRDPPKPLTPVPSDPIDEQKGTESPFNFSTPLHPDNPHKEVPKQLKPLDTAKVNGKYYEFYKLDDFITAMLGNKNQKK